MTVTDRTLDSIGLPSHPRPKQLARYLREVAKLLESDGGRAVDLAALFSARGYPAGVAGDGTGVRSSDTTTSVERAAGVDQEVPRPGRFDGADRRLARTLRLLWKTGLDIEEQVAQLLAHGDDVDELPAGTGTCVCCDRFCRPGVTGNDPANGTTNDRLRAGLCPACRSAWDRVGKPEKGPWIIARRVSLREAMERGRSPQELLQPTGSA